MRVLEIGIGTGQATRPILDTGCHLTAIEIGDQLAAFSRKKFSDYEKFQVITGDFESVELPEGAFDLIYSASAFHWIPLESGMNKVMKLLKPGGVFAWFSNSPIPSKENQTVHEAVQDVYQEYSAHFGNNDEIRDLNLLNEGVDRKLKSRVKNFESFQFVDVRPSTYYGSRNFTAENYVKMISTFSDHKAMAVNDRYDFLEKIKNTINAHGGSFTLSDKMILCMGRKRHE